MIAESSVTLSSPWNIEPLFSKEHQAEFFNKYIAPCGNNVDMDITAIEAEIERVKSHKESAQSLKTSSSSCSSGSVASSECSDDAFIDVVDVQNDDLFTSSDNDYISHSILNILDEGSITGGVSLSTFEWTDNDLDLQVANNVEVCNSSDSQSDSIPSIPSSPTLPRKRRKISEYAQWSSLTYDDRVTLVESLGQTISKEMGLREQLEVIRIINPNAVILPTDSEFVIDINSLNDEKLKKIRQFVKKNSSSSSSNCKNTVPRNVRKSSDESSSGESNSSQEVRIKPSKKQTREKRNQMKTLRQRQRKEYRQAMKEKRSGLFCKEEVVSLTICETEEEDVDII
ncbi:protein FAM199X-like isoform X2 [Ptychodera flava]|uniref:protein FAM199X-like isoform X2 n=1 Tax=Ptychodera flava TaxID=63121 RepID=UPI003969E11C